MASAALLSICSILELEKIFDWIIINFKGQLNLQNNQIQTILILVN